MWSLGQLQERDPVTLRMVDKVVVHSSDDHDQQEAKEENCLA